MEATDAPKFPPPDGQPVSEIFTGLPFVVDTKES